jgi:dTDP-4-dehydrorhamnose reductase
MQERETLSDVSDQTGAPPGARGFAQLCWRAVADSVASSGSAAGIYHWSDCGECSWYEFALAIYEEATKMSMLNKAVLLEPISTADYAAAARRPAYTVLDTTMTEQRFATRSIPWRQQLCSMLTEMKASRHV